jgi:hypothetical protein
MACSGVIVRTAFLFTSGRVVSAVISVWRNIKKSREGKLAGLKNIYRSNDGVDCMVAAASTLGIWTRNTRRRSA